MLLLNNVLAAASKNTAQNSKVDAPKLIASEHPVDRSPKICKCR